nr:RNA-directed DNA polymerase, eukaryota [Tanacetum cinerariifolium]
MTTSAMHNNIMELGSKDRPTMHALGPTTPIDRENPAQEGKVVEEIYETVSAETKSILVAEAEAVHIILNGISNDIYSTVDDSDNANEMWMAIERLMQGESINKQDVKTKLFWQLGKFTLKDGETLESYYSRFYKMMNEMMINKLKVDTL